MRNYFSYTLYCQFKRYSNSRIFTFALTVKATAFLWLLAVTIFGSVNTALAAPANPNATQKTKDVLAYIENLPNRSENKLLSGQFIGYPNLKPADVAANGEPYNSFDMARATEIYEMTGKYPALIGSDYYGRQATDTNCRQFNSSPNPSLINYWNNGGLITINLHPYRPDYHTTTKCGTRSGSNGGYDLNRVLPGGADRANWVAMMDQIAGALQNLENNGVVVLFRPLHEMDSYSWWWAKQDPTKYKNVWKDLFNYFTYTKGLNNLIWVWGPTKGVDTAYFPGSAYVDLSGWDKYGNASGSINYNGAVGTGKPVAYQEFGCGSGGSGCTSSYDFMNLLDAIKNNYPKTTYYLVWHDEYRFGNPLHNNQASVMYDPWVITRDEVDINTAPVTAEYIVDNNDTGFITVGTWATSTGLSGYLGSNYLHDGDTASNTTDTAKWMSPITTTGTYDVYLRWTAEADRPDAAPVEVNYNGGVWNGTVNQKVNGGSWVKIGRWSFTGGSGDYVMIRASDAGYTIADAVRFVKVP